MPAYETHLLMIAVKVNAGRKLLTEPWAVCYDLILFLIGQNAYNNVSIVYGSPHVLYLSRTHTKLD